MSNTRCPYSRQRLPILAQICRAVKERWHICASDGDGPHGESFGFFRYFYLLKPCIMKNLFDQDTYSEIINRLNSLSPGSQRQWGKMNVAQMLAHCKEAFKVPLSDKKMPRSFMGLLVGWMIKHKLYNEDPWKRNLPTAPNFIIKDERDFETEKQELSGMIRQFHDAGPGNVGKYPHPMFGSFTPEQWGKSMYKHLDHHLTQFGA